MVEAEEERIKERDQATKEEEKKIQASHKENPKEGGHGKKITKDTKESKKG